MPIRNPFRRAGLSDQPDDAHRNTPENDFKSTTLSGATPLQVKDPAEYKLSGKTGMAHRGGRETFSAPSIMTSGRLLLRRN